VASDRRWLCRRRAVAASGEGCQRHRNALCCAALDAQQLHLTRSAAAQDVEHQGLGLLLFPEWFSLDAMARMRFFDDNTRSWWTPATGGSNVPALNDLLGPFNLAFAATVLHGSVAIGPHKLAYASGTSILKAPKGAQLFSAQLQDKARAPAATPAADRTHAHDILGLMQHGGGRIAALGDLSCVDSSHATSNCHGLLLDMLRWAVGGAAPAWAALLRTLAEDKARRLTCCPHCVLPVACANRSVGGCSRCLLHARTDQWADVVDVIADQRRRKTLVRQCTFNANMLLLAHRVTLRCLQVAPESEMPRRPQPDLLKEASYVLNNPNTCHLNSAEGFQRTLLAVRCLKTAPAGIWQLVCSPCWYARNRRCNSGSSIVKTFMNVAQQIHMHSSVVVLMPHGTSAESRAGHSR
jgi:hypothetical protein